MNKKQNVGNWELVELLWTWGEGVSSSREEVDGSVRSNENLLFSLSRFLFSLSLPT